ncbi:MAG: tripartite tricarboxylate transporter substrate binding protein, partial [Janthinobacterium lividum]
MKRLHFPALRWRGNAAIACAAVAVAAAAAMAIGPAASAAAPLTCIAPSKPGGGNDVVCALLRNWFAGQSAPRAVHTEFMPGGVGAVAFHLVVTQRPAERDTLVAFSGGSLLNLAQGKFGGYQIGDVQWVAALGTDYGMLAVRADSPYHTLADWVRAWKRAPAAMTIATSGTAGSQDWIKMAIIARRAGISTKAIHYVAFEGGGESFVAMQAGYVDAVSGDVSEVVPQLQHGAVRVLAVMSPQRLPGLLAQVPTAREQGFDLVWPIMRGVYLGPEVPKEDVQRWRRLFDAMLADRRFAEL